MTGSPPPGGVDGESPGADLGLERARLDYCAKIFDREAERKERLERKSELYLSFVTLVLGALFLNLDSLADLRGLAGTGGPWGAVIRVVAAALGLSLLAALVSILAAMRLQRYKNEYPDRVITSLFAPDSRYLPMPDEPSLLRANAMSYAIALEHNSATNDRKARWVKAASLAIFAVVVCLAILLSVLAAAGGG